MGRPGTPGQSWRFAQPDACPSLPEGGNYVPFDWNGPRRKKYHLFFLLAGRHDFASGV
jgi:hypothetical protein